MKLNITETIKASDLVKALNNVIEFHGDKPIIMFIKKPDDSVVIAPISAISIREAGHDKDSMTEYLCITNESSQDYPDKEE